MIENIKLIPNKIYRLGSLSILSAFITTTAVYGVAMMMQVFTVLMGFAEKSQINVWLHPLAEQVELFFIFFFGAVFLQGVGLFMQSFINIAFAETFNYEVRRRFLEELFRSDASWKHDLGSTSNIMVEVIPKSANFVTSIARFLTLLVQVLLSGILCLISLPEEFLISLLAFSLILPLILFLNRRSRHLGGKILALSEKLNLQLMRSVKNFLFLKILGREQLEKKETIQIARSYYKQFMKTTIYYSIANALPITYATMVVVFLFYHFSMQGAATPTLLTLFYLLYRFAGDLGRTVAITNGLNMYKPNFDRLISLLKETYELDKVNKSSLVIVDRGKVPEHYSLKVDNLAFNYNEKSSGEFVFRDLNIELPERKLLVIKGPSGSGKTTLLMALIGVLRYSEGTLRWGGLPLEEFDSEAFRASIGYMGPEPYIISGTVRENLLYGRRQDHADEVLWQACREAEVEGFLKAMNEGLDTRLTEQGEGLSMGQKQRMGLARALLGKPRLLVLDEVTANLDRKTEEAIIQNIKAMKTRMTLLVSTHSNAFDSIADQILLLGRQPVYQNISHEEVA